MTIQNDKVITINYVLKDDQGTLIDESQDGSFCYLHGASNIIPGMENALTGRSQGDELNLVIEPVDAYGEYNPNLTQVVDRSMFDANDRSRYAVPGTGPGRPCHGHHGRQGGR